MPKKTFCTLLAVAMCVSLSACGENGGGLFASRRPERVDSAEVQFQTPAEGDPVAVFSTSLGDISVVLYPKYAPMAVENFVALAQQGYFDGILFHRVEEAFIVQSGDATGTGGSGASIWSNNAYPDEISDKLHHYSGALATAHASDGSVGNLSQFYFVATPADSIDKTAAKTLTEAGLRQEVVDTYRAAGGAPYLDGLDTVFGQVYDGMDVVDAIAAVETDDTGKPLEDVVLVNVTVTTYSAAQSGAAAPAASQSVDSASDAA